MSYIKILIIESNYKLLTAWCELFQHKEGFECVGGLSNADNIEQYVADKIPDIILIDEHFLSPRGGMETSILLKKRFPTLFIVITTLSASEKRLSEIIATGVSGYLLKNTPLNKLLEAIRSVVQGGFALSPALTPSFLQLFRQVAKSVKSSKLALLVTISILLAQSSSRTTLKQVLFTNFTINLFYLYQNLSLMGSKIVQTVVAEVELPTKIKVLLVEDGKDYRDSIIGLLNLHPQLQCVGSYADASDIVFNVENKKPSIVLMDIRLQGSRRDGIEATFILKQKFPELHILMLTALEDDENIFNAIKAGACGYLVKGGDPGKITQALLEIERDGAPGMSPFIAKKILEMMVPFIQNQKNVDMLSDKQKIILKLLIEGKSLKEIATIVESKQREIDISSTLKKDGVHYHVKEIYKKLQVHSRAELILKYGK